MPAATYDHARHVDALLRRVRQLCDRNTATDRRLECERQRREAAERRAADAELRAQRAEEAHRALLLSATRNRSHTRHG